MNRLAIWAAALLVAAPALADIKVGVYGPYTGGSAGMGVSMRNGVDQAADEINAKGGIMGQKVVLVKRDDEAKNERGAQIMQEFLDKEKVTAVLGPINTGVADNSTRYANERKVPVIINASAGAKVNEYFAQSPENYIFRIAAADPLQTELSVKEAIDVRKHTKPAVLCDDTNYGQGGRAKLEAALAKRNVKAVYTGKFKIKDTDMTPQVQEAKAAGADVLLVWGIGPELAAIANSLDRVGWKVDMIGGWTLSMAAFINNAGKNGNGATTPLTFIEGHPGQPQGRGLRRRLPQEVQREPDRGRGGRSPGLRLAVSPEAGHRAGQDHRRGQDPARAGEPAAALRRGDRHLRANRSTRPTTRP